MSSITDTISNFFATRVFGHLPSTVAGAIAAVAISLATYTSTLNLSVPWNYVAYGVSAILLAIGAAYKPATPSVAPVK
jgi:hypothetical protein